MGRHSTDVARAFAGLLRDRISAQFVLLFGSHARGDTHRDSDYDFIVVSPHFQGISPIGRSVGLHDLWWEAGGEGPIDLICLTPGEFERARDGVNLISTVLPEAIDLLASTGPVESSQVG